MADDKGDVRSGGREGNSHARMHARVRRYHFEDDVIEHMAEAQNGEASATAMCIKVFASHTKPAFAEMQIVLRDALIVQITGGEPVPKCDIDVAFTGHSTHHPPHALLPVVVTVIVVIFEVYSAVITRTSSRASCTSRTTT